MNWSRLIHPIHPNFLLLLSPNDPAKSLRLQNLVVSSPLGQRVNLSSGSAQDEASFYGEFKDKVYFPALDKLICEFENRPVEHCATFKDLQVFDPKSELFLDSKLLESLGEKYANFFQEMDVEILKAQGQTAKNLCQNNSSNSLESIHDLVKTIMALPAAFDKLLQLIRTVITLPITSASNERFFSALKRVKTYMRETMGGERLSDLLAICTETACAKNINLEILVDKFGRAKPRRYPVLL